METDWLIVDGNNLLHACPEITEHPGPVDFAAARQLLARRLDRLAGRLAGRVTLVFDGTVGGRDASFTGAAEVVYAAAAATADSVIERLVAGAPRSLRILVVTSDRPEARVVEAGGGQTLSCRAFAAWLADDAREQRRQRAQAPLSTFRPRLGDRFPR